MENVVLDIQHLDAFYGSTAPLSRKKPIQALYDINLTIGKGEIVGVVGESGCGKTTLAKSIFGIHKDITGEIIHHTQYPQMIFQDPGSSLNPVKTIGWILEEPLRMRQGFTKAMRKEKVEKMLLRVGLSGDYALRRPHELSGGQRQRVCIALSLIQDPAFIVADEPVSALDLTISAQILDLFLELADTFSLSYLLISHDLQVIYQICDRMIVMQKGRIVESGTVEEVYKNPQHPYTQKLLQS